QFERVRIALGHAIYVALAYSLLMWAVLWLTSPLVIHIFQAEGETARFFTFFCTWGTPIWVFLGCLFTANATFNNLGYPLLSTLFNWGRATLGTIPLVTFGAHFGGAEGGIIGIILGAAVFGVGALYTAYWISYRLEEKAIGAAITL